jgi:L-alanine-DL-glutamate epimerase-like enolase superfamily enzyme
VDILITGGEGFHSLDAFRECLVHDTYDILQPDLRTAGGLLTTRKVAAMCEAFHKTCIEELYTFHNGEIEVPQGPGLGLDLNEEAIAHYTV